MKNTLSFSHVLRGAFYCLMVSGTAFAQGVRYDSRVVTVASNVPVGANAPVLAIPNAFVTICMDGNCITKATVWSDEGLSVPVANPQRTDGQGRFGFWDLAGNYFYKVVLPSGALVGIYPITLGGSGGTGGGINQLAGDVFAGPSTGFANATLATVNTSPGACGDATHVCAITTDLKGRTIAQAPVAITAGSSFITSLTTTGSSGAATVSSGALNIPIYTAGAAPAFSAITGGTNTTAAMVVGTGASLGVTGSGTITATAAPLSGITGLGTGVGTFLGTPSSANLAAAITNETGTGLLVFATAPTITLPNATGLPLTTGVTGLLPHANIASTAVTPGSYTNANITVAADGSITAAANGSGSSLADCTDTSTVSFICTVPISAPSFSTTGTTPGAASLAAGTGSIPALPANSAGLAAPVTGGTSYLLKLPATITAGIPRFGAPGTVDGVNESAMTAAELSGDATTSGSNAVTVVKVDGVAYPASPSVHTQPVVTASNTVTYLTTARSLGWSFGDAATGSTLTTTAVGYITVPFACTITGWHIMADAGTVTIKTARVNGGTALPTIGSNSISTSGVSLASGTKIDSTTLTDFTSTAIAANDTLGFFITTVATAKQITFSVDCAQ